jgi:hypothetical protein
VSAASLFWGVFAVLVALACVLATGLVWPETHLLPARLSWEPEPGRHARPRARAPRQRPERAVPAIPAPGAVLSYERPDGVITVSPDGEIIISRTPAGAR